MAKRLLCLLVFLTLIPASAISSGMDYARATDEQLLSFADELSSVMIHRGLSAFISMNGKKYHCVPDCSGMETVMRVPLPELENCGYEPCKRCYKGKP